MKKGDTLRGSRDSTNSQGPLPSSDAFGRGSSTGRDDVWRGEVSSKVGSTSARGSFDNTGDSTKIDWGESSKSAGKGDVNPRYSGWGASSSRASWGDSGKLSPKPQPPSSSLHPIAPPLPPPPAPPPSMPPPSPPPPPSVQSSKSLLNFSETSGYSLAETQQYQASDSRLGKGKEPAVKVSAPSNREDMRKAYMNRIT